VPRRSARLGMRIPGRRCSFFVMSLRYPASRI
jgi:hypothetical protein